MTQPEGVSFSVDGGEVRWHRWTLVPAIDPQEGLVLHDLRYDGRPVLYRGSCAEMIVPYGEPDPMHNWRTYFDAGEYGLGACLNSLELGCDCLGEITYLDAHLADHSGAPRRIANAICLHEEDAGLLWKHTDHATGHVETRRGRRFVVNAMATVGNYEYAFRWYLGLDGGIEIEVQLHGIVSTIALGDGGPPARVERHRPGPRRPAPPAHVLLPARPRRRRHRQPGQRDRGRARPDRARDNPLGNAFRPRVTLLRTEREARRDADESASRVWAVTSADRTNAHGRPTGYRLVPGHGTATLLAQPGSSVDRRAGFARHTLWVTPYDADERFPAGAYPYQHADPGGLPAFSHDRPLEGEDVVLWYTVGVTHFVRPEDWPIMPMTKAGLALQPVGFFDRNPTLDIPRPRRIAATGTGRAASDGGERDRSRGRGARARARARSRQGPAEADGADAEAQRVDAGVEGELERFAQRGGDGRRVAEVGRFATGPAVDDVDDDQVGVALARDVDARPHRGLSAAHARR